MSASKMREIMIDREWYSALQLLKSRLLFPVINVMDAADVAEISATGLYKNCSFPQPFLFNPSGAQNQDLIKNARENEEIALVCEGEHVGTIRVKSVFLVENFDTSTDKSGKFALSGQIMLFKNAAKEQKRLVAEKIAALDPKKITGFFFNTNPIHRVHEKYIRDELNHTDLVIIFLVRNFKNDFLDFETRFECLQTVLTNFMNSERILIVPVDVTHLFYGDNKHVLYWLIASNYGCTKLLFGPNHAHLGLHIENGSLKSIFDDLRGPEMEIAIIDETVFCTKCDYFLSVRTCPHGRHHHISYKPDVILEFFKLGILPPQILVRSEVSAIIFKKLFPERHAQIEKIAYELFPNDGVFSENFANYFYENLSALHKISR